MTIQHSNSPISIPLGEGAKAFQQCKQQLAIGGCGLRPICPTCWTVHTTAINAVLNNYAALKQALQIIGESSYDDYGRTNGLLALMAHWRLKWFCRTPSQDVQSEVVPSEEDVKAILPDHHTTVMSHGNAQAIERINVRRSSLLHDALMAFSRHTFDPSANLQVRFIGEPAVDEGGPRCELFRLFKQLLRICSLVNANIDWEWHYSCAHGFRERSVQVMRRSASNRYSPWCPKPSVLCTRGCTFSDVRQCVKWSAEQMLASIPVAEIQVSLQQVRVAHAQQLLYMLHACKQLIECSWPSCIPVFVCSWWPIPSDVLLTNLLLFPTGLWVHLLS